VPPGNTAMMTGHDLAIARDSGEVAPADAGGWWSAARPCPLTLSRPLFTWSARSLHLASTSMMSGFQSPNVKQRRAVGVRHRADSGL